MVGGGLRGWAIECCQSQFSQTAPVAMATKFGTLDYVSDYQLKSACLALLLRYSDLLARNCKFCPPPLSFSALIRGEPLRIYGKALRFLKLKSSRQPTVKIW